MIRFLAIVAVIIGLATPAVALQKPVSGARCYGPSLPLGSNLPLGSTESTTEVVDAEAIVNAGASGTSGWYYVNRRGDRFVQVWRGSPQYVTDLFSAAGARDASNSILANRPPAFVPISRRDADAFERYSAGRKILAPCFSAPLGAQPG